MRLVDTDVIDKALDGALEEQRDVRFRDSLRMQLLVGFTKQVLSDAPTVDAVPVVRCKDCRHCIYNEFFDTYNCWKFSYSIPVEMDGFCSWGEKRKENKNE